VKVPTGRRSCAHAWTLTNTLLAISLGILEIDDGALETKIHSRNAASTGMQDSRIGPTKGLVYRQVTSPHADVISRQKNALNSYVPHRSRLTQPPRRTTRYEHTFFWSERRNSDGPSLSTHA